MRSPTAPVATTTCRRSSGAPLAEPPDGLMIERRPAPATVFAGARLDDFLVGGWTVTRSGHLRPESHYSGPMRRSSTNRTGAARRPEPAASGSICGGRCGTFVKTPRDAELPDATGERKWQLNARPDCLARVTTAIRLASDLLDRLDYTVGTIRRIATASGSADS